MLPSLVLFNLLPPLKLLPLGHVLRVFVLWQPGLLEYTLGGGTRHAMIEKSGAAHVERVTATD